MKRISRAIMRVIKGVIGFFDKRIISPITKFFMDVYDFFKNNRVGVEKILTNRQSLIIISLIFALLAFYTLEKKHNSMIDSSAEVIYGQLVTAEYNEALYVVEGIPETVDVTLAGRRWDVYLAKQYPINGVTLDLNGLGPGSHSVKFKYDKAVSSVEYKIDPSSVNITIYDKISVTRELSYDILHKDNLDTKLTIESVVLDRDSVIVKGASHKLEEVAIVKAIVDIDNITDTKVGSTTLSGIQLIPYDSNGNKVSNIEIVPGTVTATIKIASPSKEIPIKLIATGSLNGKAIKSLISDVKTVIIYGNEQSINSIEYLPVNVDVNGVSTNKKYTINLAKPAGVREISVKTISVELELDEIVSKDFENIPINTINLGEGLKAQALSKENSTATIIVNGSQSIIDTLEAASINAYIDLSGLSVGEHEVEVKVSSDDTRLTFSSRVKKIKVRIDKK